MPVWDKDGKLLSKEDEQMKRWKEHFQEVLNRPIPELADNDEELSIKCGRISKNEIKKAVKKLKNGKTSGGDNIPPEILKGDPSTLADVLYDLFECDLGDGSYTR